MFGAMNAPRYWQMRYDACSDVETSANTRCFSYPYCAMNFMAMLGIMILICNSSTRWRGIFKGLSHDEGATFNHIHLAGQYL
jgi:hypothetical protein